MAKANPNVKLNDAGDAADITLSKPLDIGGTKLTALRMREPTVKDQLVMDESSGGAAKKEVSFFAHLTGQAPSDIERLPMRDYQRMQDAYSLFID